MKKGFSLVLVPIIILLIAGFAALGYVNFNLAVKPEPVPSPSATPLTTTEKEPDLVEILKKILNKEINYKSVDNNINAFIDQDLGIYAYQYVSGGVVVSAYEGTIWEIDLDKEINSFKELKGGEQTAIACFVNGCEESDVVSSEINNRKWASVKYRLPAMFEKPYRKVYYTFDEPSQQLIYLEIGFEKAEEEESESQKFEEEVLTKL